MWEEVCPFGPVSPNYEMRVKQHIGFQSSITSKKQIKMRKSTKTWTWVSCVVACVAGVEGEGEGKKTSARSA